MNDAEDRTEEDAHGVIVVDEEDIQRGKTHRACEVQGESGVPGVEARMDSNGVHTTRDAWDCS